MENSDNNSLINGDQLELIPSDQMDDLHFAQSECPVLNGGKHGDFTGERLFKRRPDAYRMVVSLLAEGRGVRAIGRIAKVSPNTVMAVRDREGVAVDTQKRQMASEFRNGAQMCADAIMDKLNDQDVVDKTSLRDLSIVAGVLVDKSQLLSGGATARVENVDATPEHDDFNNYLEKMKRVEEDSTGSEPQEEPQKGNALESGRIQKNSEGVIDAEFIEDQDALESGRSEASND